MPPAPFGSEEWTLRALVARAGYAQSVSANVAVMLQEAIGDVNARLQQLGASDLANAARLQGFLSFAQSRLDEATGVAKAAAYRHLSAYAALESQVTNAQLNQVTAALGLPPRTLLIQAARLEETLKGLEVGPGIGFESWWNDFGHDLVKRYHREIRSGIVLGEGPRQIAARLLQSDGGKASVAQFSRAQVHMAVRSAVTGAQTEAALMEFREFKNVIEKVRFEAVLDQRTSATCRGLDDTVWDLDDSKLPKPPVHPNCRSTLVPIPSFKGTGIPGATAWQLTPGAKGSRTRYEDWLRQQPKSLQASILGDARAKLFQKGQLTLGQMIGKDLKPLSLEALQKVLMAPAPKPTLAPAVAPKPTPKPGPKTQPIVPNPVAAPPAPGQAPSGAIPDVLNAANPATPAPGPLARYQSLTAQQVGPRAGSNPGGVYVGSDGVKRYVKLYKDQEQAFSEMLSARLYRDLGAAAPEIEIAAGPNGTTAVASRWIEGTKKIGLSPTKEQAEEILQHFADDVFMANWDAYGLDGDNILRAADGRLLRVDTGGTFHFRAQGGKKLGGNYDPLDITELEGFAKASNTYSEVFKAAGVDPAMMDFAPQVERIASLRAKYGTGPGAWDKYLDATFPGTFRALPEEVQERFVGWLYDREYALGRAARKRRESIIAHMKLRKDGAAKDWLDLNKNKPLNEQLEPLPAVGPGKAKPKAPVTAPTTAAGPTPQVQAAPFDDLRDDPDFLKGADIKSSRYAKAHDEMTKGVQAQLAKADLTAHELEAVNAYTGSYSYTINRELWKGYNVTDTERFRHLQAVTRRYSLDRDTTLFRGAVQGDANLKVLDDAADKGLQELADTLNRMVGTEFVDKGFGSTSAVPKVADNFAHRISPSGNLQAPAGTKLAQKNAGTFYNANLIYEIEGKKGLPGIAVEAKSRGRKMTKSVGEREFIVRDGMRYLITGWQFHADGNILRIVLRLSPMP